MIHINLGNGKQPVIGVVDRNGHTQAYCEALRKAGALPHVIKLSNNKRLLIAQLAFVEGLLLPGGPDISPSYYNQKPRLYGGAGGCNPLLDYTDFILLARAYKMRLPVLGICRGMQVLNVFMGGSLHQDIECSRIGADTDAGTTNTKGRTKATLNDNNDNRGIWRSIDHRGSLRYSHNRAAMAHSIEVAAGSVLAQAGANVQMVGAVSVSNGDTITGAGTCLVNSLHHQAIDRLGDHLKVIAKAPDGIIEAIELVGTANVSANANANANPLETETQAKAKRFRWMVGVQFHPEELLDTETETETETARWASRLFEMFVSACISVSQTEAGAGSASNQISTMPLLQNAIN